MISLIICIAVIYIIACVCASFAYECETYEAIQELLYFFKNKGVNKNE